MSIESDRLAQSFMNKETQFHLGFLPTEQSSPLTKNLDREFAKSSVDGVKNLQSVDRNVLTMFRQIFESDRFRKLVDDGLATLRHGGRIVFSGCGATGRLSILLESMWRRSCVKNPVVSKYADQVFSIMTGGDFALVKSVEFFEDFQSFGRHQVRDLGLGSNDMLVAITEGGETSSVLGTVFESVERGLKVFLLFNNPAELLSEHLERSRKAITDPRVCVLDLSCGPMALAGSTRMQATTSEQLTAGGALEQIMDHLLGNPIRNYAIEFEKLLDQLEREDVRKTLASYIEFEAGIYRKHGLITYFSGEYLLDIFTDTTERSPTFMLPSFRKNDDPVSPRPWAFVKDPMLTTPEVWQKALNRPLRCLEWRLQDYAAMGAPDSVQNNPPQIRAADLLKFEIGNENMDDRTVTGMDAAVLLTAGSPDDGATIHAFAQMDAAFAEKKKLSVGDDSLADFYVPVQVCDGPLHLMKHMAVKLVLNTISTGTMVVMGRVTGNWMSWVAVSNKKLIDRAIRLIAEIGGISYEESCRRLYAAIEEVGRIQKDSDEKVSIVQYVLKDLQKRSR